MRIKSQASTIVILTKFDQIPILELLNNKDNDQILSKRYSFQEISLGQGVNGKLIQYQSGNFIGENTSFVIARISIETRKIIIDVLGTKEDADLVYSDLKQLLSTIANNTEKDFLDPILVNYESVIISELDFDYDQLLNNPFVSLVSNFIEGARNNDFVAAARAQPAGLIFDINYRTNDPHTLADYHVSLSRNAFTIQKRDGTPKDERTYKSKAPLNSEDHAVLLQQINDLFKEN